MTIEQNKKTESSYMDKYLASRIAKTKLNEKNGFDLTFLEIVVKIPDITGEELWDYAGVCLDAIGEQDVTSIKFVSLQLEMVNLWISTFNKNLKLHSVADRLDVEIQKLPQVINLTIR